MCTPEEVLSIYENGYVIFRGIVPAKMCVEAKRVVEQDAKGAATNPALLDLFRATPLIGKAVSALSAEMRLTGWAQPKNLSAHRNLGDAGLENLEEIAPRGCQVAITYPGHGGSNNQTTPVSDRITNSGFRTRDLPTLEGVGGPWSAHLDGVWGGGSAALQSRDADDTQWYHGPPTNGCPGPNDPHPNPGAMRHLNWTALVGVALTDQTLPGSGALGVLDGMHHEMASFFREQQTAGGPIGPDGPGWPRENPDAENGHGLHMIPPFLTNVTRHGAVDGPGGLRFPHPTLVKLAVGDAVLCHHLLPHGATMVKNGHGPRIQVYFRLGKSVHYREQIVDA